MTKTFLLILLLGAALSGRAQVNISMQIPPAGLLQKSQLWNVVLANSREDITDVNIKLSLQDAVSGEVVMSANTAAILCGKGVKLITEKDVLPVTYNYSDPAFSKNYVPMGSYILCYRVYHEGIKGEEPLADECMAVNVEPLSPPLLNTPADNSETETPYPQFTWIPPAPFDMFTDLSYEISICEIKEGQKPVEAIQYNTPIYFRSNLTQPTEAYASSYAALEEGKTYAWQVAALNGGSYSVKTEVWSFRVKQNAAPGTTDVTSYIQLSNTAMPVYTLTKNELSIKYYSDRKEYKGELSVTDPSGHELTRMQKNISPGDNFFIIPLNGKVEKNLIYGITLTAPGGIKKTASFTVIR